jgi:hypothetical protein
MVPLAVGIDLDKPTCCVAVAATGVHRMHHTHLFMLAAELRWQA